jgi:NADP-reducing hydrogenase subunit HndB
MAPRINNPADLLALAAKAREEIELRSGAKATKVTVHMGTCGIAAGAREVLATLLQEITAAGLTDVSLHQAGCAGLCEQEPMITITDAAGGVYRYGLLDDKAKVRLIVRQHLVGGRPVDECLLKSSPAAQRSGPTAQRNERGI